MQHQAGFANLFKPFSSNYIKHKHLKYKHWFWLCYLNNFPSLLESPWVILRITAGQEAEPCLLHRQSAWHCCHGAGRAGNTQLCRLLPSHFSSCSLQNRESVFLMHLFFFLQEWANFILHISFGMCIRSYNAIWRHCVPEIASREFSFMLHPKLLIWLFSTLPTIIKGSARSHGVLWMWLDEQTYRKMCWGKADCCSGEHPGSVGVPFRFVFHRKTVVAQM